MLFVEGELDSPDKVLYETLINDSSICVMPVGSCEKVQECVNGYNKTLNLGHNVEAFGVVDKDYLSENHIKALRNDDLYVLPMHEWENLLLDKSVLTCIAEYSKITLDFDSFLGEIKNQFNNSHRKYYINEKVRKNAEYEMYQRLNRLRDGDEIISLGISEIRERESSEIEKEESFLFNIPGKELLEIAARHLKIKANGKSSAKELYVQKFIKLLDTNGIGGELREIVCKLLPDMPLLVSANEVQQNLS